MSDIHIGRKENGLDGAEWLSQALLDLEKNVDPINYGITLGDITQNGDHNSLAKYVELRNRSSISQWFELAGNHEYFCPRHGQR